MKKILCLVLIVMMLLICVGCSNTVPDEDSATDPSLFVRVESGRMSGYNYRIVYHKETKVMYAVSYENIFTVMLDADGTLLLWEG